MSFSPADKVTLHQQCVAFVQQRIDTASEALQSASEAAAGESKSTAGDKHETARAMAHLEQERNARQLAEAKKLLQVLHRFEPAKPCDTAILGSLVVSSAGCFYLSIGAGSLALNDQTVMAISPGSPIGQAVLGKRAGDAYEFRGQKNTIVAVC